MTVNKTYGESMDLQVKSMVEFGNYDKATNHVTFDAEKLELPEGITTESVAQHVNWINDLSAVAEQATAEIARTQFAENDKLTTLDGTLAFGPFSVNTQHHLRQQVGDEFLFGHSTTAVNYVHSSEAATWLDTQRQANHELAAKLFG
jgi:hypothetical protein